MPNSFGSIADPLLAALPDSDKLRTAFATYIGSVLRSPLWSANQSGLRIPWRSAAEARNQPGLRDEFESPGLYIFGGGAEPGWPIYLGMTTGSLWTRLARRYVRGSKSQCQLALDYETALRAQGIGGFPAEVLEWYQKQYSGFSRLKGAVAFAECGINTVWFTLIPIEDSNTVRETEVKLIRIANEWNRDQKRPVLINVQDL
jgi:hypothetical protein